MGKKSRSERAGPGAERQLTLRLPGELREGLWGLVQTAGLLAIEGILEDERGALCGRAWGRQAERRYVRAGHARGEVCLGGRRVSVRRPRVRTGDGAREVSLPSWQAFRSEDVLRERAFEQMVVGVSTRKYKRSLEPMPESARARGMSKSAVSRRFVAATAQRLQELLAGDLGKLDIRVLMMDGLHFRDHVVIVAMGIDASGQKHVLGLREGATENAAACKALLVSLRERKLRTSQAMLFVIDGAKALTSAIREVFGASALIQRCQLHKRRNVLDHLPERERPDVEEVLRQAYAMRDADKAKRRLEHLARSLETERPSAAESIREGLDETLTVLRMNLPQALTRSLSTTNPIENLQGSIRRVSHRVDRWRGGGMILRWVATGILEASKGFRRLKGKDSMPALIAYLDRHSRRHALDPLHQAA